MTTSSEPTKLFVVTPDFLTKRRWIWPVILVGILVSGLVCRLAEYVGNRSLWLDEAVLAKNVLHLPLSELAAGSLTDDQCAPPGFLLSTRMVIAVVGSSERALRLIPLLAGLGAVIFFSFLAWRKLGPFGALAAVALAAWSWPLVYYANEFKQYSGDFLASVILFAVAMKVLDHSLSKGWAIALGSLGLVTLEFSQPAIFLLAAMGTMGWIFAARQKRWDEFARWTALGIVWVGFFAVQLAYSYESSLGNPALFSFHDDMFLRLWPLDALSHVLNDGVLSGWQLATSQTDWWFWLILLFVGVGVVWCEIRKEFIFIGLVVMFTVLASLLQIYPLVIRLLLYLLPLMFWLVARGVDRLARLAGGRAAPVILVVLAVALIPIGRDAYNEARQPISREHLRPVVARLAEQAQAGDLILVWDYTRYAFEYYWARTDHKNNLPVQTLLLPPHQLISPEQMTAKMEPLLAGHDRVWLVATHYEFDREMDNLHVLVEVLGKQYMGADFVPPNGTAQGIVFFIPGVSAPPTLDSTDKLE